MAIFLIPPSITFLNPKILGFHEKQHYLGGGGRGPGGAVEEEGSEMWKIKLQKIVGNLLDKFRKLYMNGTVI